MKFINHNIFKITVFVGIVLNQQSQANVLDLQNDIHSIAHKIYNTNITDLLLESSSLYNSNYIYSISKLFYNTNIVSKVINNNIIQKYINSDHSMIQTKSDYEVIPNNIKLLSQNKTDNYIDKLNIRNNYLNTLSFITNSMKNTNISQLYKQCDNNGISSLINNSNKYKAITIKIDPISNKLSNLPFIINNSNKNNTKIIRNKKNNKQKKAKNTSNKKLSISEMIKQAESSKNIPSGLLRAIGLVESRLQPYAINYRGRGYFFKTKESALQFVNNLIKKGETNFGVGCFQLHYKSHANKFSSVSVMLDPIKNIEYAAKLLNRLYKAHGYKWSNAVKRYHSSRSDLNSVYYYKVVNKLGRTI